ncbi:Ethanolamine kinase 2, partial [Lemmus lemmus]
GLRRAWRLRGGGAAGNGCAPFSSSAVLDLLPAEAGALPAVLMGHGGEGGGLRRLPGDTRAPEGRPFTCFRVAVDQDDILPCAWRLIRELRPHWKPEQVRTKLWEESRGLYPILPPMATLSPCLRFKDGITNKLVACYVEEDMRDCVLGRVYREHTELLVDWENEASHFFWALWALIQNQFSTTSFDFLR